jgi:hypothetical protein
LGQDEAWQSRFGQASQAIADRYLHQKLPAPTVLAHCDVVQCQFQRDQPVQQRLKPLHPSHRLQLSLKAGGGRSFNTTHSLAARAQNSSRLGSWSSLYSWQQVAAEGSNSNRKQQQQQTATTGNAGSYICKQAAMRNDHSSSGSSNGEQP